MFSNLKSVDEIDTQKKLLKKETKDSIHSKLILECHHCEEENEIKISREIKCKNCNKPITGESVKYKSNGIVVLGALFGGIMAGAVIEDKELVSSEALYVSGTALATYAIVARSKLETEYKMMKKCISKFSGTSGATTEVRDNCFCVVKKLSSFLTSSLSKDKAWVEDELEKKYKKCSNKD